MNTRLSIVFVVAFLTFATFARSTGAVDIMNIDGVMYTVTITDDENRGTYIVDIGPEGTLLSICRRCIVSLDEGNTIEVFGDEVVVIKDGNLQPYIMMRPFLQNPQS